MKEDKISMVLVGLAVVPLTLSGFIGYCIGIKSKAEPRAAYSTADLNQDGTADFVVENRVGYKYPLFEIQEGDKLIYVPASQMEQRQKDAVIKVDYDRIEDLLNKQ